MSFSAYGVRVGLRVNDKAILKRVLTRLPPGAKPADARVVNHLYSLTGFANNSNGKLRRFNLGYWNLARFARTRSFEDLLDGFESHLQLTVAEYAPRRVFVHAGVVGWKGRAIVIPGMSFSGKRRPSRRRPGRAIRRSTRSGTGSGNPRSSSSSRPRRTRISPRSSI